MISSITGVACHSDPLGTDSKTGSRHDVGTITAASGQRLGQNLDGFDTPTLFGLGTSAPYLHDGSATTVEAAITAHSGVSLSGADLTMADLSDADLSFANLVGADLTDADVTGVDWDGALCPDGTKAKDHKQTCDGHL